MHIILVLCLFIVCAWLVEPFVTWRLLVLAAPALLVPATPGLVLLTAAVGCLLRSYQGDNGYAFAAGLLAGLAVWLAPPLFPFIIAGYGALFLHWVKSPPAVLLAAAGAGVFDVLGFATAINPPHGGYQIISATHVSVLYAAMGLALLITGGACWQMENKMVRHAKWLGLGLLIALVAVWGLGFHLAGGRVALHGVAWLAALPAALAAWRAFGRRGRAQWTYLAACLLLAGLAGQAAAVLIGLAVLLPLAGSEFWLRLTKPASKLPWAV